MTIDDMIDQRAATSVTFSRHWLGVPWHAHGAIYNVMAGSFHLFPWTATRILVTPINHDIDDSEALSRDWEVVGGDLWGGLRAVLREMPEGQRLRLAEELLVAFDKGEFTVIDESEQLRLFAGTEFSET